MPLRVGGVVQTETGTLIHIKSAKYAEKKILMDCVVLRNLFDGPISKGPTHQIELGETEDIHRGRSPFTRCTLIEPTPEINAALA